MKLRTVTPGSWSLGPDNFESTGNGIIAVSSAEAVSPPEILLLESATLWGRAKCCKEHALVHVLLISSQGKPVYLPVVDAPWVLPKAWPPAISATVSESFIPIRPKASRMSSAEVLGSPLPLGPCGFT